MIAERSLSDDELQGWIRQVIKRVWVKGDKVVEIEPHDEYKRLLAAIRKVYNQPPSSPKQSVHQTQPALKPAVLIIAK
jgi:hypothetical protein